MDTIYALSSGRPPAAIAVVRISGPAAFDAVRSLAGTLPPERRAVLRTLRDEDGAPLDDALVLIFPGPKTATGEDLAELHLHGGRAVMDAVLRALARRPGLRPAVGGEFTRRALDNGRIDLAQAQGLADLLEAETDRARRAALAAAEGVVGRAVRGWLDRLSSVSALVEASLDHSDEDDVADDTLSHAREEGWRLRTDIAEALARPSMERLRDGALVVIAGPTNAGKSSLFNAMLGRDAAIVTPIAGTTRDVLEAGVVRDGVAFRLVDTAGLARDTADPIEAIGVRRADELIVHADTVLWLGEPDLAPDRSVLIHARADIRPRVPSGSMPVSTFEPPSIDRLWEVIVRRHGSATSFDEAHFHEAQRRGLEDAMTALRHFLDADDLLIAAEHLRAAQRALAALLGVDATEAMLDALFSRFCIGK
jgi:tRNA modification GTPase